MPTEKPLFIRKPITTEDIIQALEKLAPTLTPETRREIAQDYLRTIRDVNKKASAKKTEKLDLTKLHDSILTEMVLQKTNVQFEGISFKH